MRFPKKVVDCAVSLYHKGLTLKAVKSSILEIFGLSVSTTAIWKWCKRFAKKSKRIIKGLADLLHGDETKLKTYKKGVYFWFWAIKCPKTKQIVGYHISENRTLQDTRFLLWEARRRFPVSYLPKAIRTDSMPAYRFAIMKVFNHEVKHDKVKSFKHGNNVIENFFRCKRRFPRFRNIESARRYIAHWVFKYNEEKSQFLEMFIIPLVKAIKCINFIRDAFIEEEKNLPWETFKKVCGRLEV